MYVDEQLIVDELFGGEQIFVTTTTTTITTTTTTIDPYRCLIIASLKLSYDYIRNSYCSFDNF